MRTLPELLGARPPLPGVLEIADALILFDSPLLDQRFQEAIAMHPDPRLRAKLAALPPRVAHGSRLTRRAAVAWEDVMGGAVDAAFADRAERFLLEAFLDAAESQIRLKTFMADHAPTAEVRRLVDAAIDVHRELTAVLREAVTPLGGTLPGEEPYVGGSDGDLRSRVEGAIRRMHESGTRPRTLVLSANALRELRDQGLFRERRADVLGVPVQVDFTWTGSTFALLGFDSVPLEEIVAET